MRRDLWRWEVALAIATFACHAPGLANGYLDWDDPENLLTNAHLDGFTFDNLRWMATSVHLGHWHPLTWLSLALDRTLLGPSAFASHLVSILIHVCSALLLHRVIRTLVVGAPFACFLGALLFAVHPMRVESVAWASERRDVLCTTFVLVATLLYLHGKPRWSLVAFAAACLAKAAAVPFPVVLLVVDAVVLRRSLRASGPWLEKAPFSIVAALTAWQAWHGQVAAGAAASFELLPLADRARQAAYGLCWYLRETVWPWPLLAIHERPLRLPFTEPRIAVAVIAVFGFTAACVLGRVRREVVAVAIAHAAWLAPVLGFFQSGRPLVADRYGDLASLPVAIGVATLCRHRPVRVGVAIAVLGYASTTLWYTTRWHDTVTLMVHVVHHDPANSTAHYHLGAVDLRAAILAHREGRSAEELRLAQDAEAHFRAALQRYPEDVTTLTELGTACLGQGRLREAAELWRQVLELAPDPASNAALNLAELGRAHPELVRR